MREIVKKQWDYTFIENNDKYYLLVMCGSVAVFEINIELNNEEVLHYKKNGIKYIDELAKKIQFSPSNYAERNLPDGVSNSEIS